MTESGSAVFTEEDLKVYVERRFAKFVSALEAIGDTHGDIHRDIPLSGRKLTKKQAEINAQNYRDYSRMRIELYRRAAELENTFHLYESLFERVPVELTVNMRDLATRSMRDFEKAELSLLCGKYEKAIANVTAKV